MKNQLFSWMLQPLAWCIARVRVNRVTHESIEGREFIRKERTWFSPILILLGNCVFRFRRAPVRVLHLRQWQHWEKAIHEALGADVPSETSRGLLLTKISGKPLCGLVSAEEDPMSFDDVIERLRLALEALYRLHQIEIVVDGKPAMVSHGDASVTNAIIADDEKLATWLDFDLRHDMRQPASVRHADDLRAFMNTAVPCFGPEEPTDELKTRFMESMEQAYPNEQTWRLFDLTGGAVDVFSCAQYFRGRKVRS